MDYYCLHSTVSELLSQLFPGLSTLPKMIHGRSGCLALCENLLAVVVDSCTDTQS